MPATSDPLFCPSARRKLLPITVPAMRCLSILLAWSLTVGPLHPGAAAGQAPPDKAAPPPPSEKPPASPDAPAPVAVPVLVSVAELADRVRPSIVAIQVAGRDGRMQGLGTGFVVSADGLIATNQHVIGEGRPITVQFADGRSFPVTAIAASQRSSDLALIRIKADKLAALELGNSKQIKQGDPVVAVGNPLGLKFSVVSGVVSGLREIDGRELIQLAIPIEPGNSGGPVLDGQGRVVGVVTMKSVVTPNLGFAVQIDALKPLLEKPNPIPMERWLTIGALDPTEWTPLFGARWRQRAGRILVDGLGQGFGGRSLCLAELPLPELPFDVSVDVKLDREEGAAGLVFFSDGKDQHLGFYPSNGKLRLSKFDGPDVFSWQVLQEKSVPEYRAGDWNTLRVRLETDKVSCFVNGVLVCEAQPAGSAPGKIGLGKFRDTAAEFRRFQVGKEIPSRQPTSEQRARIEQIVAEFVSPGSRRARAAGPGRLDDLLPRLPAEGEPGRAVLRERAAELERAAARLRRLADLAHQAEVRGEIVKALAGDESQADLLRAALLVARLDNEELDIEPYVQEIDRMAARIRESLPADADRAARHAALNRQMFETDGFRGSRGDYYHKSNSYLNEVIDDREGLPITLAVVYLELGRRLDLQFEGVGLPSHFVVASVSEQGERQLLDLFEGAKVISREEAAQLVRRNTGIELRDEHLAAVSKRAIVTRMLFNLFGVARDAQDATLMLRYVEPIVALNPEFGQERWMRAVLRFQDGQLHSAAEDTRWLLEHHPDGVDLDRVRELDAFIASRLGE